MFDWIFGRRRRFAVDAASVSECGPVRADNQDSLFLDPRGCLYCVADGMGGGEGGAVASRMVCERLAVAAEGARGFADLMKRSADAIANANREICSYAAARRWRQMGSTLTAVFLTPDGGGEAVLAHVGDSRIYRLRDGSLELMTHDHTVAGELSRRSSIRGLADELQKRAGALSHVLTRAMGIEENVIPDWRKVDVRTGDALMICSDGVYDMVDAAGIRAALQAGPTAREAVDALARAVVAGGANDNYTAIVLKIGEAA